MAQSSAESCYNAACNAGMSVGHLRMVINEFLNKYTDTVPYESPMITLDSKYAVCMTNNSKYTKHTRNISMIMNLVRNCKKCKMQKIDWCEEGLKLSDIVTKNVSEPDLTPRMKYIMVRLEN